MTRQIAHISKRLLWACITFLSVSFSLSAIAVTASDNSPKPGNYCPSKDILLVTAEGLSASVQLAIGSRAAMINGEPVMAMSKLTSTGTSLHLAASRGAAARTVLLIDTVIQSKVGDDYAGMLTWFPLLQASLLTLPPDETVTAASDLVGKASDLMQSDKGSDALESLKEARHMLTCDALDIPLQAAIQAQGSLLEQPGRDTKSSAYDNLINSLRSALAYALGKSE
jgi:hypothetical protein